MYLSILYTYINWIVCSCGGEFSFSIQRFLFIIILIHYVFFNYHVLLHKHISLFVGSSISSFVHVTNNCNVVNLYMHSYWNWVVYPYAHTFILLFLFCTLLPYFLYPSQVDQNRADQGKKKFLLVLVGSVVIGAEFGREDRGSIPHNCDREGAGITWYQNWPPNQI
jgi:hypothetical protein